MKRRLVIDCAGAMLGGAARYLRELQTYLANNPDNDIELIGVGRQLTPRWLIQRELKAASADVRLSLNNASFVNPIGTNVTLLQNILQFATPADYRRLRFTPSRRLRLQTPVVRSFAGASETLVAPCTRMAEQVAAVAPKLQDKVVVRFYPIAAPSWAGTAPTNQRDVLLPIVPSPYKHLDEHIPEFLEASENIPAGPVRLIVPTRPEQFPDLAAHPRMKFIGPQTTEALDRWWQDCEAVFFPPEFEAFGFPVGEARVYGRHVIAQDTAQNHEIGGHALMPYTRHDQRSLRDAIEAAVAGFPEPDPEPFLPDTYFEWLLYKTSNMTTSDTVGR